MENHKGHNASPACCENAAPKKPWFLGKTSLTVLVISSLVFLSYPLSALAAFRENFFSYVRQIGWLVALGFLIGGVIDRYVPREYVSLVLAAKKKRSILYSVLLGFLMSACSHGILALALELHKKGASTPVVVSFLLASPWANLPITFLLFGFFGAKALFIVLGALLVAFVTGLVFQHLEARGLIETNTRTMTLEKGYSIVQDVRRRFTGTRFTARRIAEDATLVFRGAVDLARMTLWWLLIGIALSSLAAAFIPPQIFQRFMGPTFLGMLATLALATVMEVCSEGTAPLAFEIYRQTGAFGNAFVFLMAGVVTDYTEIGLIWANVGRKTALWIPVVAVPQVVLLGFIANQLWSTR